MNRRFERRSRAGKGSQHDGAAELERRLEALVRSEKEQRAALEEWISDLSTQELGELERRIAANVDLLEDARVLAGREKDESEDRESGVETDTDRRASGRFGRGAAPGDGSAIEDEEATALERRLHALMTSDSEHRQALERWLSELRAERTREADHRISVAEALLGEARRVAAETAAERRAREELEAERAEAKRQVEEAERRIRTDSGQDSRKARKRDAQRLRRELAQARRALMEKDELVAARDQALADKHAELAGKDKEARALQRERAALERQLGEAFKEARSAREALEQQRAELDERSVEVERARGRIESMSAALAAAHRAEELPDEDGWTPQAARPEPDRGGQAVAAAGDESAHCSVCFRMPEGVTPKELQTTGWRFSAGVWLCPDCQIRGWGLPAERRGRRLPFSRARQ